MGRDQPKKKKVVMTPLAIVMVSPSSNSRVNDGNTPINGISTQSGTPSTQPQTTEKSELRKESLDEDDEQVES